TFDGGFWHTEDHAGFFTLGDCHSAGLLYLAQALRPVLPHPRHQDRNRAPAVFLGHATKQNVHAGTVAIDRSLVIEHYDVARGQPADGHMPASGANQNSPSLRANISVKPSGMCCTTRIVPGKSGGSCDNRNSRACGPPVEIPMAT